MTVYIAAYVAMFAAMMLTLLKFGSWQTSRAKPGSVKLDAIADELAAIDRKLQAGELSQDEARATRVETIERLQGSKGFAPSPATIAFACAGLAVLALALYRFDALSISQVLPQTAASPVHDQETDSLRAFLQSAKSSVPAQINGPMSVPNEQRALPDVDTMISGLAQRLETKPEDWEGWQMLGWSYFHTDRFAEAERAYTKAVSLKPESTELRAAYEEAKAKSDSIAAAETKSSDQDQTGMIRAMVDRLAKRLASSPRDLDGWIKLIRSRKVLGESEGAVATLKQGLEAFKDSPDEQTRLADAAQQLGVTGD